MGNSKNEREGRKKERGTDRRRARKGTGKDCRTRTEQRRGEEEKLGRQAPGKGCEIDVGGELEFPLAGKEIILAC